MSSMRNAVHRRSHRERAQPIERQKLGLLEKHKDYSLRAADFNKKKKQLKNLKAKAADRNEDEFAFGMLSRKGPVGVLSKGKRWDGTVNGDRGNKVMGMDEVRLLKTQDIGYLRTVRNVAGREVKGLEERVVALGGSLKEDAAASDDEDDEWEDEMPARKKVKKIVFFDGVPDREEKLGMEAGNGAEDEDEDEDDSDDGDKKKTGAAARAEQQQRLLLKLQRRLQSARKKLKTLARAENGLEVQRAQMAKTVTVGGVTKTGKKFKVRERKR